MAVPHTFANQSGNVPAQWLDDNFNACLQQEGFPGGIVLGTPAGGTSLIPLSPSQLYALLKPILPWEFLAFMGGIQPAPSAFIGRYQPSTNVIINQAQCYASCSVAPTSPTVTFSIFNGASIIGTVAFNAGSTTGVVTINSGPVTINAGTLLAIQGPSTADTTLADVNVTLGGQRG